MQNIVVVLLVYKIIVHNFCLCLHDHSLHFVLTFLHMLVSKLVNKSSTYLNIYYLLNILFHLDYCMYVHV
jgi:hypothetical protein